MEKGFLMFASDKEVLAALTGEQVKSLMIALTDYYGTGEVNVPSDIMPVFIMFRQRIDRGNKAYEDKCEQNRKNIQKRWEKENTDVKDSVQQDTEAYEEQENGTEDTNEYDRIPSNTTVYDRTNQDTKAYETYQYKEKQKQNNNIKGDNNITKPPSSSKTRRLTITECYKRIEERHYPPDLEETVKTWATYKTEKNQGYKETGFKSLLTQIEKKVTEMGLQPVIDIITLSMSNNWQGIIWEKARSGPQASPYLQRIDNRVSDVDKWAQQIRAEGGRAWQ